MGRMSDHQLDLISVIEDEFRSGRIDSLKAASQLNLAGVSVGEIERIIDDNTAEHIKTISRKMWEGMARKIADKLDKSSKNIANDVD